MDLFNEKGIQPMLIAEQVDPYDDEDSIFELKLDGCRCIAYCSKSLKKDSAYKHPKHGFNILNYKIMPFYIHSVWQHQNFRSVNITDILHPCFTNTKNIFQKLVPHYRVSNHTTQHQFFLPEIHFLIPLQ